MSLEPAVPEQASANRPAAAFQKAAETFRLPSATIPPRSLAASAAAARDEAAARRLWDLTEELTGTRAPA